jgi:hypothetical protein
MNPASRPSATHVSFIASGSSTAPSRPPTQAPAPGPQLVPPGTEQTRRSPLALWHLLSLDAPTVATVWTLFIARCVHLALPWSAAAAMFVAVWMIYAADRLLDARLLDNPSLHPPDLEARHRFHHQHRSRFLSVILLSAVLLIWLLHRIDSRALHLYVLLATLLGAWMLMIHARPLPNGITHRLPKELAVGIFFPAAIFIPTIARLPQLRLTLIPAAALFALVCTLNCLYLYKWEHPQHVAVSTAHSTTQWATAHLNQIASTTVTLAAVAAALTLPHHFIAIGLPALACALSAAFLLVLNTLRHHVTAIHLRAAADLVLLTPLLFLPLLFFSAR